MTPSFTELCAATHYSFLRGASSPGDMVMHAMSLDHGGIGIADRNSVAGVVRAYVALRDARDLAEEEGYGLPDFKLLVGTRLAFIDGTPDIIAYPVNRNGWGRLTRLLSAGNLRAEKGHCILTADDLVGFLSSDLALIVMEEATPIEIMPHETAKPSEVTKTYKILKRSKEQRERDPVQRLNKLAIVLKDKTPHIWLAATMPRGGSDHRRLAKRMALSEQLGLPLLATNDPLFATPQQRPLADILTCIAEKTTIEKAGRLLSVNAERHLKSPDEMARLFRDCPQAIAETQKLLNLIEFTLDDLRYRYPDEPVPKGWTPQGWLEERCWRAAREKYPDEIPERLRKQLGEELAIIGRLEYAPYFLTVHDIVKYARSVGILCQGRGSAANSTVCYLLGVTSVDPMEHDLLFSRFISEERREPPDIDVDFEHERREEVIQYIYARYGRHRAGITATVIHYRSRSAIREVGKALGLSEDITSRLSSTVWGSYASKDPEKRFAETGLDPENSEIKRLGDLVQQILQFPRHLGQHVGGFVLTQDRLDETVPIHNAAMEDRTFIEWDKEDIDALELMKVDVLGLGMLSCIRKAFDLMRDTDLGDYELATVPTEDPVTYDMLCEGDSIGVFQVESRAQMNMLPRLRPREFYDLVIQVAIVRPGPIEGDMVHPYLRRRSGIEKVTLPSPKPPHPPDELHDVLGKTKGVPLFQEQAMKLAIVAADFSPGDANKLRRAMATFRNVGTIHHFQEKMVEGMVARGYTRDFAERCYKQIQGFGSYGFPESHAQSFAILVYISSWIKCHHPAVFAAALLNSQPMGFYAPAQIVRDAREHDVEVRAIDINYSDWDNGLEKSTGDIALRLGLRQIDGFREEWAESMMETQPFASIEDLARRARLPSRALRLLADADAMRSIPATAGTASEDGCLRASEKGLNRREALWEVRRLPTGQLPLFEAADAKELAEEEDARLPIMTKGEHVITDYQSIRLSLKGHPMEFLREELREDSVLSCEELANAPNGSFAKVAGVVLIRQRPGKGNAIFITLEDETGIANLLLWASRFEPYRRPVMAARLMIASGEVQKSKEGVIHLMVSHIKDATPMLDQIDARDRSVIPLPNIDAAKGSGDPREAMQTATQPAKSNGGHPRNVRILPKSRDFH